MSNKPNATAENDPLCDLDSQVHREGLDQQYNSLDSQRDAGEAYIRSQANEGWELVTDRYDDGGFSGGNIERPALKRMMEDRDSFPSRDSHQTSPSLGANQRQIL